MKNSRSFRTLLLCFVLCGFVLYACSKARNSPEPGIEAGVQSTPAGLITSSPTEGSTNPDLARQALVNFFACLHAGDYEQAAEIFRGSYDVLRDHNPGIDPDDHASLFRNACTINGAVCLEVLKAEPRDQPSPTEFQFAVVFMAEDGSPFSRGDCCGGTSSSQTQQVEFLYTVRLEGDGVYRVVDLPVYLP